MSSLLQTKTDDETELAADKIVRWIPTHIQGNQISLTWESTYKHVMIWNEKFGTI